MASTTEKSTTIQKPFRCSEDLDTKLNRAKGALMLRTGARISDNQFLIELIEMGLEVMLRQIEDGKIPVLK